MKIWVIRAGRKGEQEELARARNCAVIGYTSGDFPISDLSHFNSPEELKAGVCRSYGTRRGAQKAPQMWKFAHEVQSRDGVVLPLKTQPGMFVFGEVNGHYHYEAECPDERARHRRNVQWGSPISRNNLSDAADNALNTRRTVYLLDGDSSDEILLVVRRNRNPSGDR